MTINEYDAIYQHPIFKHMQLVFSETGQTDITLTNKDICSEEMSLEESLCEGDSLAYGSCNSSCFKIKVVNNSSFVGKQVVVSQIVGEDNNYCLADEDDNYIVTEDGDYLTLEIESSGTTTVPYGTYKVYSDKLTNDRMWRELVCYDAMYDIINADVADWFSGLTFPMTIKNLRDGFFSYLGVTQVTTSLINDNFVTEGGFVAEGQLSGKTIIEAICQLNGVFGHINREGKFEYISVPSSESLTYSWYIDGTGEYEDYLTEKITGISARASSDDVGTSVGTTTNQWIIMNNPLVYGKEGTQELITALTNLLNKVKDVTYRPFSVDTYGNPGLPIGTSIQLNVRRYDPENGYSTFAINSLVMKRELTGLQALKDSISAVGDKAQKSGVNEIQSQIIRTAGKVHEVRVDLDNFISEIEEADYGTKIEQNATSIVLKVDSNGKIGYQQLALDPETGLSTFDINTDYISFVANKDFDLSAVNVVIDAENFSLDRRGCVACNDLTVTGGSLSFTGDGTGTEPEYDLKVIDYTNNMVTLAIYSDTINDHNVFDIVITEECLPYFNSNYETSTGTSSCRKWLVIYNAAGTSVIGSGRLLYSTDPSNVDYTNQLGNKVEGDKIPFVLDSYRGYVYSPGPIYSFGVNTDGTMEVDMKYLQITDEGALTCTSGEIGKWEINSDGLIREVNNKSTYLYTSGLHLEATDTTWSNTWESDLTNQTLTFSQNGSTGISISALMPDGLAIETSGSIAANDIFLDSLSAYTGYLGPIIQSFLNERCALGQRYQFTLACWGEITTGKTELHLWAPCKFQPNVPDGRTLTVHALTQSIKVGAYSASGFIGGLNAGDSVLSYLYSAVVSRITDEIILELDTDGTWATQNHLPVTGTITIDFTV